MPTRWIAIWIWTVALALHGCGAAPEAPLPASGSAPQPSAAGSPPPAPVPTSLAGNETAPELIEQPEPRLSPELEEMLSKVDRGVAAKLRLVVREDGTVGEVRILEVRPPDLEAAQLFARETAAYVANWRYRPATRDGRPIPARLEFVIDASPQEN
jgi:hypothetical protein